MTQTKEEYVQEQMTRWRAYAQCQCAAHVVEAERSYRESWEGQKKLEEWFETPDGKKLKRQMGRLVKKLERSAKR